MTMNIKVPIQILENGKELGLPFYATSQSAGMDLKAAVTEKVILKPLERAIIPCGFSMALPVGYEAQIRPRSGLSANHGVTVLNSPGTIDADYRGEIKVILINLGSSDFIVTPAMRIAQMVIAPVGQIEWEKVTAFTEMTERATGGFGSTGV